LSIYLGELSLRGGVLEFFDGLITMISGLVD